jgi:hypothetical protein
VLTKQAARFQQPKLQLHHLIIILQKRKCNMMNDKSYKSTAPTRSSRTSRPAPTSTSHYTATAAAFVFHYASPYHPGLAESGF